MVQEGSYFPGWELTPKDLAGHYDATTNRLSNYWQYDAAGNQTRDPVGQNCVYDAENRVVSARTDQGAVSGSYSYDGEGRRVQKVAGGSTTVFVYNAQGQLIAEYTNATAAGSGGTKYLTADTLGSTRVVTMGGSGAVKARYDYLPFGEELGTQSGHPRYGMAEYGSGETLRQKFGAKERDTETGLDYFLARYYAGPQGRFTSPDEFQGGPREIFTLGSGSPTKQALPYAEIANPQSLNKYQHTFNNPLRYVDPDGHMPDDDGGIIDRIINSVNEVVGSLVGRLQRGVNGGNPNPEVDHTHPLGGKEKFIDDYMQDVGKRINLTMELGKMVDVTGAGSIYIGLATGSKTDVAAGMAGALLHFGSPAKALSHFNKHAAEWGTGAFANSVQYLKAARELILSKGSEVVRYENAAGKILTYNTKTNEFATNTGKRIHTFFRPKDGQKYVDDEIAKGGYTLIK